jgi:chitinase
LFPAARGSIIALVEALQAPGVMPRTSYIYTLPVGFNNANFNEMRDPFYGTLSTYFDRISSMSYVGIWYGDGWESWHMTALFGETGATPTSIDNTVQALRAAGVPDEKIGVGIGFYGSAYENGIWSGATFVHRDPPDIPAYVTAPHQSTETAAIRYSDNALSYSNIMRYVHSGTAYRWDDMAKVPYLSFSTPAIFDFPGVADMRTTYVTYDDEQAIAEKGSYVRKNGLGGVIIWTISEGYLGNWKATGELDPLMKAVKAAFRN